MNKELIARIAVQSSMRFAEAGPDPKAQTTLLRSMIETADVFFGVLPDGHPYMIKGEDRLHQIVSGALGNVSVEFGAVFVRSNDEAEAMRQVFGDAAKRLRSTGKHRLKIVRQQSVIEDRIDAHIDPSHDACSEDGRGDF